MKVKRRKKRVVLFTPPYHCGVVEVAGRWPPLYLYYIAKSARDAGWEPIIIDAMTLDLRVDDLVKRIVDLEPEVVATSSITATINLCLEILQKVKNRLKDVITVIGGVHPTFCYHELISEDSCVDFVVIGEGEVTFRDLLVAIDCDIDPKGVSGIAFLDDREIYVTGFRHFQRELDSLNPDWSFFDPTLYTYFVYPRSVLSAIDTSRGCSSNCTFCSQKKFWKRTWRYRSPEWVVNTVEMLNKKFGTDVILFTDEYPTNDRERWIEILKGLKRLNENRSIDGPIRFLIETRVDDIVRDSDIIPLYKDAGIVHVYVGVESGSDRTLEGIKKSIDAAMSKEAITILNRNGIITETSFIMGFPDDTKETMEETIRAAKWFDPYFAHFLALAPWPYADIYSQMKDYIAVSDYSSYNLVTPVIRPKEMTLKDVDRFIIRAYAEFYSYRMQHLDKMDEEQKKYMIKSMKLIMKSSFLKQKLLSLKLPTTFFKRYMT